MELIEVGDKLVPTYRVVWVLQVVVCSPERS